MEDRNVIDNSEFKFYCPYSARLNCFAEDGKQLAEKVGGKVVYARAPKSDEEGKWVKPAWMFLFKTEKMFKKFNRLLRFFSLDGFIQLGQLKPFEKLLCMESCNEMVDSILDGVSLKESVAGGIKNE